MVRLLRAAAPAMHRRRGGRMPRQVQPDGLRLEYYKAIRARAVEPCARAMAVVRDEILRLLADERAELHLDAGGRKDRARELIDKAAARAAQAVNERELAEVARQFGVRTSEFQKVQLDRQVRQAVGVPLSSVEKPTTDRIPGFVRENVDLVKTVPERYFDSLRETVSTAFEEGWHVDQLADEIALRGDVAESDARRIARDQIGKLNAQVNQDRQEALGVTGYVWRGALDARERDEHREREGQHFEWDDPPEDGHPGEPIQCRCYAEPDLSAIVGGLDEE
jgi:SPP1 gp7 family putative phage head morphogenesis protein